jgi:predicted AAA+ superfamily ATPase
MYQAVRHLLEDGIPPGRIWWLRLDHPLWMELSLGHLMQLIREEHDESLYYVFLDELTYAREWDLWLKTFYDERWPIRLAGSSSSTAALRDRRLESGVGRWEEQYLAPYSFSEYLDLIGRGVDIPVGETLAETLRLCCETRVDLSGLRELRRRFLLTGGFPELLLSGYASSGNDESALLQSQRILRNDAVERAVYKDIPQVFGIDSPLALERLLYTLAGQIAGILSPGSIATDLGLSQQTFERYLSYLERAFLVFLLPNYASQEGTVQRRGRKLYFIDGAVRNAALQRGLGPLTDAAEMGLLLENLVASHVHSLCLQTQVRLYHWRDKKDEVDLVYDDPNGRLALEVATSSSHRRHGLDALLKRHPRFQGCAYMITAEGLPFAQSPGEDGIGTIPLDLFLIAVGRSMQRALARNLGT